VSTRKEVLEPGTLLSGLALSRIKWLKYENMDKQQNRKFINGTWEVLHLQSILCLRVSLCDENERQFSFKANCAAARAAPLSVADTFLVKFG
jgi:hypothetical protein